MSTIIDYRMWRIAFNAIYAEVGAANILETMQDRYTITGWTALEDYTGIRISCVDERLLAEFLLRYA